MLYQYKKEDTATYHSLFKVGFLISEVPIEVMKGLRQEIWTLIKTNFKDATPYNYSLAGSIEKEFQLFDSVKIVENYISNITPQYFLHEGDKHKKDLKYIIKKAPNDKGKDIWVNLQKKYEYNPIHCHDGILSFVIYVNIPYNLEEEKNLPNTLNKNSKGYSSFKFHYPNFLSPGGIAQTTLDIDKSFEGKMILFPSWLKHEVTPFFTSDRYRISVAGNLSTLD